MCSRTRVDNEQDEDKGKMEGDEDDWGLVVGDDQTNGRSEARKGEKKSQRDDRRVMC